MALQFACTGCGKKYSVDDIHAGKKFQCKSCGAALRVPQAEPETPDLFGLDDQDDIPAAKPGGGEVIRRGGSSGGGNSGGGVPVGVFIGGGVVALLVLVGGMFAMTGSKATENVLVDPAQTEVAQPEKALAEPVDDAPAAPKAPAVFPSSKKKVESVATSWKVKPDPTPGAIVLGADLKWTIPIPDSFSRDDILYPTVPSPYVLLGGNHNDDQHRELWDLRGPTREGQIRGEIETAKPMALSMDGAYFATHTNPVPRMTDIWRLSDGKRILQIPDGQNIPDVVDFVGTEKLVIGTSYAKRLQVIDFIKNKVLFNIDTPDGWSSRPHAVAISPGGNYLALQAKEQIVIYEMTGGKLVATLDMPKVDGQTTDTKGFAFSPDGTALSLLTKWAFNAPRIVTFNMTTGKLESDLQKEGYANLKELFSFETRPLQWLTDGSGWLIYDTTIVERKTGQIVWTLPFDQKKGLEEDKRRFLDSEHVALVSKGRSGKVLRVETVPRDKVQTAMGLVQSGGSAVDAALPPLKTVDRSSAKKLTLPTTASAWKVPADIVTGAKKTTTRPIPLKIKPVEVLGIVLSGAESGHAVVVGGPEGQIANDVKTSEIGGTPRRVDRIDLTTGASLGRFQIPASSQVIALSPSGSNVLLITGITQDRLDLHNAADGKHLIGWRPYEGIQGDGKRVVWSAFVSDKSVLTMSKSGTLALWSVPDGKALYIAANAGQGVAALGAGRKTVAVYRDSTLKFLDAASGDVLGTSQKLGGAGASGLQAAAFRGDGKELAVVVNGSIVRVDLTSGKVIEEFVSPIPAAKSLQYAGPRFLVVDNRQVFELANKRVVWHFVGGIHAGENPDGIHWAIPRVIGQAGVLRGFEVPNPDLTAVLTVESSSKTKVLIKEGLTVGIEVEAAPPRDPEGFRGQVVSGLSNQLTNLGAKAGSGGAAKLVASFQDKETGRIIELMKLGGPTPEKRNTPERELTCRLTLVDAGGAPVVLYEQQFGSRMFGMQGLPPGENDWDGYLRNVRWLAGAKQLTDYALPYYAGRAGASVAILPGSTQLGLAMP